MDTKDSFLNLINQGLLSLKANFTFEALADYLIANGATVNEWRPASEPPTEDGKYLVLITSFSGRHTWQDVCKFANNLEKVNKFDFMGVKRAGWYDYEDGDYYKVNNITHWMPLPKSPKGVE